MPLDGLALRLGFCLLPSLASAAPVDPLISASCACPCALGFGGVLLFAAFR